MIVPVRWLSRADLYYVHSYEFLPICLALRGRGCVIYDAHDFYQEILPRELHSEFFERYALPGLRRVEKAAARRSNGVVTVSHSVAEAMQGAFAVHPHVVPNVVDRRMNEVAKDNIRVRLALASDQVLLVMVGNRKVGYPFDFVTAMLDNLPPNVHLAFLGRGYEPDEDHQRRPGVKGRLHFIPAVPAPEVSSFIGSADSGLLLYWPISRSYRGALPNGFFHLLDAGLPIARTALPEVERIIGGEAVGPLLDPDDPEKAAKALTSFLCDGNARRIAARAAQALGHRWNWAAQEPSLRRIVDQACLKHA
jgi:hypothetical protein